MNIEPKHNLLSSKSDTEQSFASNENQRIEALESFQFSHIVLWKQEIRVRKLSSVENFMVLPRDVLDTRTLTLVVNTTVCMSHLLGGGWHAQLVRIGFRVSSRGYWGSRSDRARDYK
jgi:hypothetical protein